MSQQPPPSATNRVSLTLARRPSAANPPSPAPVRQPSATDWAFSAPVRNLKANKGLIKYILLTMITFGIYHLVVMSSVSDDINIIASRYDGRKTMHYCLLFFLVGPLTLGIGFIVWHHRISARIGYELRRRQIYYSFGAGSYWLWDVLGILIVIGPYIYTYKLFKATNKLCMHYNVYG